MKEIQLTQGKTALVDDEFFEVLNEFKWAVKKSGNTHYAYRTISFCQAKFTGVKKDGLRYVAAIQINGKSKRLGRFFTAMEAEMRYREESEKLIEEERKIKGIPSNMHH